MNVMCYSSVQDICEGFWRLILFVNFYKYVKLV